MCSPADGSELSHIDGVQTVLANRVGDFDAWESYRLNVGNELGGQRPWLGDLHLLAAYCQALNETQVKQNLAAGADPEL